MGITVCHLPLFRQQRSIPGRVWRGDDEKRVQGDGAACWRKPFKVVNVVRKLHIYAGLQSLLALILFGLTGLCATYIKSPYFSPPPESMVEIPIDGDLQHSDRQVVDQVFEQLKIPLAPRPPDWSTKSLANGEVEFEVRTPQALTRVSIIRSANQARIRRRPLSLAERVVILHTITWNRPLSNADRRCLLWALYIEFSAWALAFFILTGVYLWLNSPVRRRRFGFPFFLGGWAVMIAFLVAML